MLARTRFSAAVLFLVALALLAAPPRGHAASGLKITKPPGHWISAVIGGRTAFPQYTFTNEESTPQTFSIAEPVATSHNGWVIHLEHQRSNCGEHSPVVLQPGGSCTATLRFQPDALDLFRADWTMWFGGHQSHIEINAEGVKPPFTWGSRLVTRQEHFGSHPMGVSETKTFTLTNLGIEEAHVSRVELQGDTQSFELLENDCAGRWIAARASCTAKVRFRVRGTGDYWATLMAVAPGDGTLGPFKFPLPLVGNGKLP